ncbi:MAG TPA: hypothetical protein ENI62_02415 [Gammaproteobacteria bacterium]|nr:hypothetical protein [Gammaproteobacteria bacterium]
MWLKKVFIGGVLVTGFAVTPAHAVVQSDIHIQSDSDFVRLDGDRRLYQEVKGFFDKGYPASSVMLHGVSLGLTIDDLVYLAVTSNPDRAQEFYNTAMSLLPSLPAWACNLAKTNENRYQLNYSLADLGPKPTIAAVAQRFFDGDQRLIPFPDWQNGAAHFQAPTAEVAKLKGPDYWYFPPQKRIASKQRPVFVSLYLDTKKIVVDDRYGQLEASKAAGKATVPVVVLFNEAYQREVSRFGKKPKAGKIMDAFFASGEELTPVPDWEQGDYQIMANTDELLKLFDVPKKQDVDPARWQEITQSVQKNGFKKPMLITLQAEGNNRFLNDPARLAVANDLGIKNVPVDFFYSRLNRLACGQLATSCADQVCNSAIAGGADPGICVPAAAAGLSKAPASVPPTGGHGGNTREVSPN